MTTTTPPTPNAAPPLSRATHVYLSGRQIVLTVYLRRAAGAAGAAAAAYKYIYFRRDEEELCWPKHQEENRSKRSRRRKSRSFCFLLIAGTEYIYIRAHARRHLFERFSFVISIPSRRVCVCIDVYIYIYNLYYLYMYLKGRRMPLLAVQAKVRKEVSD